MGGALALTLLLKLKDFPHRKRPLHHPSRCALRMVPLPPYRRGGCKQSRSRDAVRTRVIVTLRKFLRSPHRSSPENAGGGCQQPQDPCFKPRNVRKEEKESGTPINAGPYPPHLSMRRALCKARSPIGVPPRLSACGTIHPKAQPGPGFVTHRLNEAGSPPARVAHPAMHLARRS